MTAGSTLKSAPLPPGAAPLGSIDPLHIIRGYYAPSAIERIPFCGLADNIIADNHKKVNNSWSRKKIRGQEREENRTNENN
jgi:hypothetical protein